MLTSDNTLLNVLFTLGMCTLMFGSVALAFWLGFVRPKRRAVRHLTSIAGQLGLTLGWGAKSALPTFRSSSSNFWARWPVALGKRSGFSVEVTVQYSESWGTHPGRVRHLPVTTVIVGGTKQIDTGGSVGVFEDYRPEVGSGLMAAKVFMPVLKGFLFPKTDVRIVRHSSLQFEATIGNEAARRSLLNSQLKARLSALPRRLLGLGFQGTAMAIYWLGVEEDSTVIEQAFRIGAECLESVTGS